MDPLAVFRGEQHGGEQFEIRVLTVDGEPWFKGCDVAACLGYANLHQALIKNVECDDKKQFADLQQGSLPDITPSNQQPHEVFINESGVWQLILRSRSRSRQ